MRQIQRVLLSFLLPLLLAVPAHAGTLALEQALELRSIGEASAPVTVNEYSSLSCPHCAAFHADTFPKLKAEFIDTGKVRFVYHDFPLGGLATAAAMLTRCGRPEAYFGFLEVLFQNQKTWLTTDTPLEELERYSRLAGMSPDDVQECLDNEALFKEIEARKASYHKDLGIDSTPTFFIGEKKISGNLAYEDFKDILNQAVEAAN